MGRREPALAGLTSLTEILDVLAVGASSYDRRDAVLLALLRIAQQRSTQHHTPTPDASLPAAGHKVAINLKLGTLNRLTRGGIWRTHNLRANREVAMDYDETAPVGVWSALDRPSAEDCVDYGVAALPDPAEATVDTLLAWAAHHDLLSGDDLQILHLAYREGLDHHSGAQQLGITPAAFRKRVSRAVQRLKDGYNQVHARLAQDTGP